MTTTKRAGFDGMRAYINAVTKLKPLTSADELVLGERISKGDMAARHELTEKSLWLALLYARRFAVKSPGHFEDLVSAGNMGLFGATGRWKPGNVRFVTFAKYWVLEYVGSYVQSNRDVIKIPEKLQGIRSKLRRGVELNEVEVKAWARKSRYISPDVISIDTERGTGSSLAEILVRSRADDDPTYMAEVRDSVQEAMSFLAARSRDIVWRHVGLGETFKSIGLSYGVGQSRTIKIFNRSMAKIRDNQQRKAS